MEIPYIFSGTGNFLKHSSSLALSLGGKEAFLDVKVRSYCSIQALEMS